MKQEIIDLILGKDVLSVGEIEKKYPPRQLAKDVIVSRFGPSPTGFFHIGGLSTVLINERLAHQSGGLFLLRIEDTDQKRKTDGAVELIFDTLKDYEIPVDEAPYNEGAYGPYTQSQRAEIYKAYVAEFLRRDLAYPCFCSEEELDAEHQKQQAHKIRTGYYAGYAKCRNLSEDEIVEKIKSGLKPIIRFKSPGDYSKKIIVEDLIRGKREFPQNDLDIVIFKSDGLPTYHFAHLIDDHFMGTTHVIRGDEWFSSLPLHIQLFTSAGWRAPKYAHLSTIQKMDNGAKRKLSKRLDPEANLAYFGQNGYPKQAVVEYLLNLANSNFEDWRRQNPTLPNTQFQLSFNKLNKSGALFDFVKLASISKEVIGRMRAEELFNQGYEWATRFDKPWADKMNQYKDDVIRALNIERENVKKVRKDITTFADIHQEIAFFFDDEFVPPTLSEHEKEVLSAYADIYSEADDKQAWFNGVKALAEKMGYCSDMKEYKQNPDQYKGSVADVARIIRLAITGREQSPDLWEVMHVLGYERVVERLNVKKA